MTPPSQQQASTTTAATAAEGATEDGDGGGGGGEAFGTPRRDLNKEEQPTAITPAGSQPPADPTPFSPPYVHQQPPASTTTGGTATSKDAGPQHPGLSNRNAKAVKYVDTLLGRANREKIPEEDARQALEYFEAAKQSNQADDFKAACSYFETSFLLNPKLTTLISTANMHLKLRNPTVASEIYMRLLQNPSVPQREREVALRKLAMCETMSGEAGAS